MKRLLSVLLLLAAPAHAGNLTYYADDALYSLDTATGVSARLGDSESYASLTRTPDGLYGVAEGDVAFNGSHLYNMTGEYPERRMYRDGLEIGLMNWVEGEAAMAWHDDDLHILHGDEGAMWLTILRKSVWDLSGDGIVDDRDLNLLLSGPFVLADIYGLLADFGRRVDLSGGDWVSIHDAYRTPDWHPHFLRDPVDAAFVDDRFYVSDGNGYVVEIDLATGETSFIGGEGALGLAAGGAASQAIPEPSGWLLLAVGIIVLQKRRRR